MVIWMCGIIGVINNNAIKKIIEGLLNMEYRGYDSSGVAYFYNNDFKINKTLESPNNLITDDFFNIGIGHTRWATHGKVTEKNAHPILSSSKNLVIVHNGVIENYIELKEKYLKDVHLETETDTEVLINLVELFLKENSLLDSIKKTCDIIDGSYAFLILYKGDPKTIYLSCFNMPLIIGNGNEEIIIASDVLAFNNNISKVYRFPSKYIGKISLNDNLSFPFESFDLKEIKVEKNNKYHMYDEILYSTKGIENLYNSYFKDNKEINNIRNLFRKKKSVSFVASGSSYNACLVAQYFLNKNYKIKTNVYLASEFIYNTYPKSDIYFFVSQSGETLDTIKALNKVEKESITISLTNVKTSTIAIKTKYNFDMLCKKEIGVASTKAFIASVFFFYGLFNENIRYKEIINSIKEVIKDEKKIYELALNCKKYNNLIFLGRGLDGIINYENILKIKEISYINVENYFGGELKHGPLALIDNNSCVFVINTNELTNNIMRANIAEVSTRGGNCLVFSSKETTKISDLYSFRCSNDESIFSCAVFFQFFAYYLSIIKGNNPDRPKNLAKSVTVE